jgi:predicted DCC family thiol-disulfide oxidoreductase YuxK
MLESVSTKQPIILFDGVCNLCNASVNWVIDVDRQGVFRFASLQSKAATAVLAAAGFSGPLPDSVILVDEAGVHVRSTAALRIAQRLGFPWSMAVLGYVLPEFLRDWIYKWIAANRYRWFGRQESCRLPSPATAGRFLATPSDSADAP